MPCAGTRLRKSTPLFWLALRLHIFDHLPPKKGASPDRDTFVHLQDKVTVGTYEVGCSACREARVAVAGGLRAIGPGLMVLVGIGREDTVRDIDWMVEKIVNLRIFETEEGQLDKSLLDTGGSLLLVSQFTLYGDCRKGDGRRSRMPWD